MNKKILPISVLIPTMNRPFALKRTIERYLSAKCVPSQIVVIDQSQQEKDIQTNRQFLDQINEINIVYYYQEEPSLTMARNMAIKFATEEIIICSDDDIDVYPDTLRNVYEIMHKSSVAMIAGIDDNMPISDSKIGYLLGTKSYINRKRGHVTYSMLGRFPSVIVDTTETMWAMGFFFVIRKSLVEKWQLKWDEHLLGYAYAEDLDFSYSYYKRAKYEEWKCIITKMVRVLHLASQEYRTPSRKSTFMYVLHRYYLNNKHSRGILGNIAISWCNIWIYIQRKIKNQSAEDMLDAMKYYQKNKQNVLNGYFKYE